MEHDVHNTIFNIAVDFVCYSNRSLFLTGKAGTGKTTFLKYIQTHSNKKMAVTAPTGVAAINAGGVTLHSFFQLPFGTYLPEMSSGWGSTEDQRFFNRKQLLSNLRLRQKQRDVIRSLELLVIDEVSMVRSDLLDAIDTVMRFVRKKPYLPFGGVQLLLIGDLYQLSPVVTRSEQAQLYSYYASPFFFDAKVLQELPIVPITLQKIYRQQDEEFIQLLNKIRNNQCSGEDFQFLNRFYQPTFVPDNKDGYITLTTHNRTAASLNESALERLPGKLVTISARIEKNFPENAYPADETLRLKVGAQVMFIKNDVGENRRYFNGKIGIIKKLDPSLKTIEISFPDETDTITIEPETWNNIRYQYDKESDNIKEEKLGSFSQYPIRLAWAVTIHKSQGLTFEKAIIDAGRSFAAGQVYVALSRLTGLKGMVLHSKILPESIHTDQRILRFSDRNPSHADYEQLLQEAQLDYARRLLLSTYDWESIENACTEHYKSFQAQRQVPDKELAVRKAANLLDQQLALRKVAEKFQSILMGLLSANDFKKIQKRNQDASAWFLESMEGSIADLKAHIRAQEGKSKVKKYVRDLQQLLSLLERKEELLKRSRELTVALSEATNIREAMIRFNAPVIASATATQSISSKPKRGASMQQSLLLYQAGKSIKEIAEERNLAESTIAGHLTTFIPTGEVSFTLFITAEEAAEILEAAKAIKEQNITALKEKLGNRFSYPQLRAAMALLEKGAPER